MRHYSIGQKLQAIGTLTIRNDKITPADYHDIREWLALAGPGFNTPSLSDKILERIEAVFQIYFQ